MQSALCAVILERSIREVNDLRKSQLPDLIYISKKLLLHNEHQIFHSYRAQILHSVQSTPFEDDRRRERTAK